MEKVQLVMVVHSHQPVGNFDFVFEQAVERSYTPFLDVLERHPGVRLGLHYSGPLLEWLEANNSAFLDRISRLYERGQVELLGGGFYEPMLSVLPEQDALGQIEMMGEYLERRFGAVPEGIWLTERVWEPELARLLSRTGIRYTLVDDTHFYYAGVEPRRLLGYHVTEKAGDALAIFPIDRELRYSIPFRPVSEVIEDLRLEAGNGPRGVTYGDDGEKFGVWPGTHEWVFEKGWLEEFFSALEQTDFIEVLSPAHYLNIHPYTSRIYLPTASYEEMLTWAMPTEAIHRYEDLKKELEKTDLAGHARAFIRGGLWQNFMSKYTEANHLHKKMLSVSRKLAEALEDEEPWTREHEEARRALYRGQCNCAYWHGLFGGLYLPHLRDAIYRQLIRAENVLDLRAQGAEDWIAYDERDFDCDLEDEVIVENALMNVYIDPGDGGTITEIDYRPLDFCPTNTLTRRVEGYHRHLQEVHDTDQDALSPVDQPTSIHDIVRVKESGLAEKVIADVFTRRCLMDRFPGPGTTLEDLQQATYREEGNFLGNRYHVERIGVDEEGDCDFELMLTRPGHLARGHLKFPLLMEKVISVPADRAEVAVTYTLRNPEDNALDLSFCPELNLTLLSGDDNKRFYQFEGIIGPGPRLRTSGEVEETSWFALTDRHQNLRIRLEFDPPATLWRHPVETVSQSEDGFERIFQGSAIIPRWEMTIPPKSHQQVNIKMVFQRLEEQFEGDLAP
jgi:alpha-amylase